MAEIGEAGSLGNAATYVHAAQGFSPKINELRQEIERHRTLPNVLVESMTKAGFFSLWRCRALGGPELTFVEFAQVIEELSRADGSVGWCAMVASVLSRLSGYFPGCRPKDFQRRQPNCRKHQSDWKSDPRCRRLSGERALELRQFHPTQQLDCWKFDRAGRRRPTTRQ